MDDKAIEKLFKQHEKKSLFVIGFSYTEFKVVKGFLLGHKITNITNSQEGESLWDKLELASFHFILINTEEDENKDLLNRLIESNRFNKTPMFVFSKLPDVSKASYGKRKMIGRFCSLPLNIGEFEKKLIDVLKKENIERSSVCGLNDDLVNYHKVCNDYVAGRYDNAKKEMVEYIKTHPDFEDAYIKMAEIMIAQSDLNHAKKVLQKAAGLDANDSRIPLLYGKIAAMENNKKLAHSSFGLALKGDPNNAQMLSEMGDTCLEHGWNDDAIDYFNKAKDSSPEYLYIYNRMGIALSREERFDEAQEQYNQALSIDENDAGVHFNLGMLEKRRGNKEEAINYFKKVLEFDSSIHEAKEMIEKLLSE